MSTDVCVLGPVVFDEWSTPEQITQGGKHTLAVVVKGTGTNAVYARFLDPDRKLKYPDPSGKK